jgi:hypothetical protein
MALPQLEEKDQLNQPAPPVTKPNLPATRQNGGSKNKKKTQ